MKANLTKLSIVVAISVFVGAVIGFSVNDSPEQSYSEPIYDEPDANDTDIDWCIIFLSNEGSEIAHVTLMVVGEVVFDEEIPVGKISEVMVYNATGDMLIISWNGYTRLFSEPLRNGATLSIKLWDDGVMEYRVEG